MAGGEGQEARVGPVWSSQGIPEGVGRKESFTFGKRVSTMTNRTQIGWARFDRSKKEYVFQSGLRRPDFVHDWIRCYAHG